MSDTGVVDLAERNLAVVRERWPAIAAWLEAAPPPAMLAWVADAPWPTLVLDGIRLAGAFDPRSEAELQARLVPVSSANASIYGFGQGKLARTLLGRPRICSLKVVVLNPTVAFQSLAHLDHTDWIADGRVELARADELVELEPPFAGLPACLRLACDGGARVRDLVRLELGAPHVRRRVEERAEAMRERLDQNRELLAADGDVGDFFGTRPAATAYVVAAGPTLVDHLEAIGRRGSDTLLIAVDGALRTLVAAGIRPDVVVSIDTDREALLGLLDVGAADVVGTTLVYEPLVHGDVLRAWPGPRAATYTAHPRYETLARELPKAQLHGAGSVLHPAVDLAVKAGCAHVTLFGADFAQVGGFTHAEGFAWRKPVRADHRGPWVLNGRGERVPTIPALIGYLRDLERYVAVHPEVRFDRASVEGADIHGVPLSEELG